MTTERKEIREIYSDSFLISVKEVLNLPEDFRFEEKNIKNINVSDDIKNQLVGLCVHNRNIRTQYNDKRTKGELPSMTLNEKWPYSVLETYFGIKL